MAAPNKNTGFVLKREIDLGQILTVVSIVGSLIGFAIAWNNDRALRDKEYADRVRRSASVVTAKVERWAELADRYFEDLQPMLVDVSEKVAATGSREPANRILYKGLVTARAQASQRIVDEQLQIAYLELYGYVPAFQGIFDRTIAEIKAAESAAHEVLSRRLQDILLDHEILALRNSPKVGNRMRAVVEEERAKLRNRLTGISLPLRQKMLAVIELDDARLRNARQGSGLGSIFPLEAPAGQSRR